MTREKFFRPRTISWGELCFKFSSTRFASVLVIKFWITFLKKNGENFSNPRENQEKSTIKSRKHDERNKCNVQCVLSFDDTGKRLSWALISENCFVTRFSCFLLFKNLFPSGNSIHLKANEIKIFLQLR